MNHKQVLVKVVLLVLLVVGHDYVQGSQIERRDHKDGLRAGCSCPPAPPCVILPCPTSIPCPCLNTHTYPELVDRLPSIPAAAVSRPFSVATGYPVGANAPGYSAPAPSPAAASAAAGLGGFPALPSFPNYPSFPVSNQQPTQPPVVGTPAVASPVATPPSKVDPIAALLGASAALPTPPTPTTTTPTTTPASPIAAPPAVIPPIAVPEKKESIATTAVDASLDNAIDMPSADILQSLDDLFKEAETSGSLKPESPAKLENDLMVKQLEHEMNKLTKEVDFAHKQMIAGLTASPVADSLPASPDSSVTSTPEKKKRRAIIQPIIISTTSPAGGATTAAAGRGAASSQTVAVTSAPAAAPAARKGSRASAIAAANAMDSQIRAELPPKPAEPAPLSDVHHILKPRQLTLEEVRNRLTPKLWKQLLRETGGRRRRRRPAKKPRKPRKKVKKVKKQKKGKIPTLTIRKRKVIKAKNVPKWAKAGQKKPIKFKWGAKPKRVVKKERKPRLNFTPPKFAKRVKKRKPGVPPRKVVIKPRKIRRKGRKVKGRKAKKGKRRGRGRKAKGRKGKKGKRRGRGRKAKGRKGKKGKRRGKGRKAKGRKGKKGKRRGQKKLKGRKGKKRKALKVPKWAKRKPPPQPAAPKKKKAIGKKGGKRKKKIAKWARVPKGGFRKEAAAKKEMEKMMGAWKRTPKDCSKCDAEKDLWAKFKCQNACTKNKKALPKNNRKAPKKAKAKKGKAAKKLGKKKAKKAKKAKKPSPFGLDLGLDL